RAYCQPSGIFVAFKGAQKGAPRFTKGMPKYYHSSAWLERGFCSNCGRPLGIRTPQGHSVMVGTLDHPEEWPPNQAHSGIESHIRFGPSLLSRAARVTSSWSTEPISARTSSGPATARRSSTRAIAEETICDVDPAIGPARW